MRFRKATVVMMGRRDRNKAKTGAGGVVVFCLTLVFTERYSAGVRILPS